MLRILALVALVIALAVGATGARGANLSTTFAYTVPCCGGEAQTPSYARRDGIYVLVSRLGPSQYLHIGYRNTSGGIIAQKLGFYGQTEINWGGNGSSGQYAKAFCKIEVADRPGTGSASPSGTTRHDGARAFLRIRRIGGLARYGHSRRSLRCDGVRSGSG